MNFSEQRTEVAAAYAKAWGSIETPKHNKSVKVKTKTGGEYSFDYTDLTGIFEAIRKLLSENGIAVLQDTGTEVDEKGQREIFIQTTLLHTSGEYIMSSQLKLVANPSIQDLGGQITYVKRYQLSAMMGLSTESDDDANGVMGNQVSQMNPNQSYAGAPVPTEPKVASAKQQSMIKAKLKGVSETLNTTPDELYKQIQDKFKTKTKIENLNPTGASKIIEQLLKLEEGQLL